MNTGAEDGACHAFAPRCRTILAGSGIDVARTIPPTAAALIAPTASLVVSADLHPVAAELLLDAARPIHEFPLPVDAQAFHENGPSLLRWLPGPYAGAATQRPALVRRIAPIERALEQGKGDAEAHRQRIDDIDRRLTGGLRQASGRTRIAC